MNANTRNRNLLAMALATAVLSPATWAGQGRSVGQAAHDHVAQGQDAQRQDAQERTPAREVNRAATEQTKPTTTPPPSPPQSQGAENAAAHSSMAQRDLWTRLDTNGDGRISATEGASDEDFDADFTAMDADRDGYITDREYRTATQEELKAGPATGGVGAASQSTAAMRDAMSRLDVNADGALSAGESQADATIKSNFATIDANSDGMVSSAEYRAWVNAERK